MGELFRLLKKGNKSALIAAIVNTIIAIAKGVVYSFTGNVALFAETMHSLGDAANQFFVFVGSALSKKSPTKQFPNGFGRLVNLVLLFAVLIVGIMAYETIKEGYHHILHPADSDGFLLNIGVLGFALILELYVLYKAMKEVLHEVGIEDSGIKVFVTSFAYLNRAKPATKLVFLEDLVATSGGLLAIFAVVISNFTDIHWVEGAASIIIGFMMFFVVGRVFLDNAAGVIGRSDEEMEARIGEMVMADPDVKDIQELVVVKEGEEVHVELEVEIDPELTVAQADDIKDRLQADIMAEKGVKHVTIEFDEEDHINTWANKGTTENKQ
ncbi:MAG: cation diffusion facilitator family transporter [Neobacillus sp.]